MDRACPLPGRQKWCEGYTKHFLQYNHCTTATATNITINTAVTVTTTDATTTSSISGSIAELSEIIM